MTLMILTTHNEQDAKHMKLYGLFRLGLASTLGVNQLFAAHPLSFATQIIAVFFLYALVTCLLNWRAPKAKTFGLTFQTIVDITFIILMMHCFSSNQSGIGLLLIITIVFASLLSDGRYSIFYASMATIGVLLESFYNILDKPESTGNLSNAVLLSLSCFATAWLAHTLANRMQRSEHLATQRGLDIEHLAKINAMITQEMPNGVLVIDQHFRLRHFNQQASKLLGMQHEQLAIAMEDQQDMRETLPSLMALYQPQGTISLMPNDAIKLNLANRDLGIRFHAISEFEESGAVIFLEDWSQIQTQAHQVKLAALGRLTANIAHEIRNPLSSISHANQLLQEDDHDPATMRMLQIISDNVQRLDQIIKDVLELNRRDRTNQEMFYINAFVNDFYAQFCAVEKIDNKQFLCNVLQQDVEVMFDKRHINQILWNLCKNGWRHSQRNDKSLVLRLEPDASGQFVHVYISDDGGGIDPKIQPHVFEPFMTTEKTGTGLGLYIGRELAEANGAKLNFSTGKSGTEFSLTIKKALI